MNAVSEKLNILLVEDNLADQFLLEESLLSSRLAIANIFTATRLQDAIGLLQQQAVHLILLDLSLPDSFGVGTLVSLREITQSVPIIILTGLDDPEVALKTLNENAQDYLVKGEFDTGLLVKTIEYSFQRKKSEERILASEEKYRLMFYKNPFPMWVNDADTLQMLEVNDAAIHTYGYTREEFLQLTVHDILIIPENNAAFADALLETRQQHRKKNGHAIIADVTYYPVNYFGKTAMQAQVIDMTEKVMLENELNLQKQKMLEAVLNAQENERRSIGRELHDNINQILTAVKLNLDLARENQFNNEMFISNCQKSISTVMTEIRKLSKELIIPISIKELGIVNSIEDLLKEMLQLKRIDWHFSVEGLKDNILTEEHKLHLYRIVQEQLTNILKYASATFISVHLTADAQQIYLKITDNGNGFDTTQKRQGVGITNIISRAELFDGKVTIDSVPGKGCSMEVILNVKPADMLKDLARLDTPIFDKFQKNA